MQRSTDSSPPLTPDSPSTKSPAALYLSNKYVVIDLEVDTAHGDWGNPVFADNQLLLACWRHAGAADGVLESCWSDELGQQRLLEAIASADFIVAHNAKYELGWLRRLGCDLRRLRVFDTKIAAYLQQCGRKGDTSLDAISRARGLGGKDPVVDLMMHAGVNPRDMPRPWLEQRCRKDVLDTEQIFLAQRAELEKAGQLSLLYTRCSLTPALADIEAQGLCLDAEAVDAAVKAARADAARLEALFSERYGAINPRSPKQVAELIYDKLAFKPVKKNGEPLRETNAKALAKLKATTAEQKEFLALKGEISKAQALLSKNLNFFEYVCKEQGGVFYGQFNQTVTATGRLSASGLRTPAGAVQFQNLPRRLKPLFKARRADWLVAEVDGSQLEFRVAAFLGGDSQARRDIANPNWDAHLTSAAAMSQRDYDELAAAYAAGDKKAAALRQAAKSETFKPLYGGQRGTKEQERWYAAFRERYPQLNATQERWVAEVLSTRELRTAWGQRFRWPDASIDSKGYVNCKSEVYNYPVQALATAEIIPIAVTSFWHRAADSPVGRGIRLCNTVHDSALCEIAPAIRAEFIELAKKAFTTDVYRYLERFYGIEWPADLPLGVGIKIGERWGTGDEESYDIYPDGREVKRK